MKWVTVTQWVRAGMAQVPPDQSLTSRSVVNPHAIPVRGCVKPGIARMEAASLSLEKRPGKAGPMGLGERYSMKFG